MNKEERKWAGGAKRWLVLFGIPIIIFLIGAWQWSRSDLAAPGTDAKIAQYESAIEELKQLRADHKDRRSMAMVTDGEGRTVSAALQQKRYEIALAELKSGSIDVNVTSRQLQPTLAMCTLVFSTLALLWSVIGVVYQRRMGRQAMESRAKLLACFNRGRKLLPMYMVVMVLLLFAAAIPMLIYEIMPILRHSDYSKGDMKIMLLLVGMVLFLLWSGGKILWNVWQASRKPLENEPIEVMGQSVSREQVPQLWSFVDRVVSHTGAGTPNSIVVGLNEGFFVTEHPVKLSNGTLLPKGRVLYLPLPYMAFLSAAEVAAVIGHELGHFIGEDTLYSQHFSPIYSATVNHIVAVAGGEDYEESWLDILRKPATLFGEMFLDSFHEAVSYWSRQRELAADAVGASVSHPIAVASSLLRITALEPHVVEALQATWDKGQTVEGGVLAHVRQLVRAKGMVDPSAYLQNRQSHPTDTHPELAIRLEALGLSATPSLLARAMEPEGSTLLQDFGLEKTTSGATASTLARAVTSAHVPDVTSSLQHELTGAAATARAEKIDELTAMVRGASEPKVVKERMWLILGFWGLVALFGLGFGTGMSLDTKAKADIHQIGWGLLAVGVGCSIVFLLMWKRSRTAPMVIEHQGLQLFNHPQRVSWQDVNDFQFTETNHTFVVTLKMEPDAKVPDFGVSKLRCRNNRKGHELSVTLLGIGGKRAEKLMEELVGTWRAFYAKQELERMQVSA